MHIHQLIQEHLRHHMSIYIFTCGLFLMGIVFGAIVVNSMNFVQREDLYFYLSQFFEQVVDDDLKSYKEIFKSSYFFHLKYLLLLYVLGISIIGLPLVWILIFSKGLFIGFTVGFIVNQLGFKGLILASLSIAPQNIVIIPIYIVGTSFAMIFSLMLLRKIMRQNISYSIFKPFQIYTIVFIILLASSSLASILEIYISHTAMHSYLKALY